MAIAITSAEVKRKAMIGSADSTYDSAITSLIAEMQPAIEYSIAEKYLDDTTNTRLQATLKLGILEVITGEFLEQLRREAGATEEVSIAGVSLGSAGVRGVDLIQQGATRLAPYLKSTLPMMCETGVLSNTASSETEFSGETEVC